MLTIESVSLCPPALHFILKSDRVPYSTQQEEGAVHSEASVGASGESAAVAGGGWKRWAVCDIFIK